MELTGENPVTGQKQTIVLPDVLQFVMPAQHAVTILGALGDYGPHKVVQPVLANFEQQLLSQRVVQPQPGPPPVDSAILDVPSEAPPAVLEAANG